SYVNLLALPTNVTSDIYIELNSDGIQNLKNHIDKQNTESELVDVYSIHGVKVRNNINAEDATTGLPHGAYIVNGKVVIK
ncbi:MAG: hypothetical protein IKR18_05620, partial [Bacteroidaceae bacterium]|nr:hypothetical protein [Bacteroidaceae bacterium]